ncbi:MAG: SCO family protein [Actinomycetes bacterium]
MVSNRNKLVALAGLALLLIAVGIFALSRPSGTASLDSGYSGSLMPPNVPLADFHLVSENGGPVSLATLKGRTSIVTFLYTSCRDICPLTTQQIRGAMDQLGHDISVVAITADPRGDTPVAVKKWLASQQMTGRMHWALGSPAQTVTVWNAWGVAGQATSTDHSAYVFVLDRDGRRCVSWPATQLTPEGLSHDIKLLESRNGICRV